MKKTVKILGILIVICSAYFTNLIDCSAESLQFGQGVIQGMPSNMFTPFTQEALDRERWDSTGAVAKTNIDWTTDESQSSKRKATSVGVETGFMPFFSASTNVDTSSSSNSYGYNVNFYGLFESSNYKRGTRGFTSDDYTPQAKSLMNDPVAFFDEYGNQYVAQAKGGVFIEAKLTLSFNSYSAAKSCKVAATAGGGYGPFSASVTTSVENSSSDSSTSGSVKLSITQRGGVPTDIGKLMKNIADAYNKNRGEGSDAKTGGGEIDLDSVKSYKAFADAFAEAWSNYVHTITDQIQDGRNLAVYEVTTKDYPEHTGIPQGVEENREPLKKCIILIFCGVLST
jgi:hypothetical protein